MEKEHPGTSHQNEKKTPIWQFRIVEQWVKTVLINDVVEPKAFICELCCQKGMDIGKWARAKIDNYIGIDPSEDNLTETRKRLEEKKNPFQSRFIRADPLKEDIKIHLLPSEAEKCNAVACFSGIGTSFQTEALAKQFLSNVSALLAPGGFFFGMLPDSSAIWYRSQKTGKALMVIKGDFYSIEFKDDQFNHFGTDFTMSLADEPPLKECLVHFPSWIKLAEEYGLKMLEITNFNDFYEDQKRIQFHGEQLKALGLKVKFEPNQRDVAGLFTTFCFQKVEKEK
eukprot:TRINITY_DN8189_c0_g1_i1.p1 TRINITY_DN8189_c0_g1~~TRINITY_DN8189_c0_g1_i1.p1  ORF type:complete len:283 (-),score=66.75 TRINITY_DN8189_c0_g1_i1:15-863(-)